MDDQDRECILAEARQTIEEVSEQAAGWDAERRELERDPIRYHDDMIRRRGAPGASPYVRQNPDPGLVYRTTTTPLPAPAPAAEPQPSSDGEASADDVWGTLAAIDQCLDAFECRTDRLFDANERRAKETADLQRQLTHLQGQVDTLMSLFGKSGDVIPLPPGRKYSA
jgi:hypothetical protein